MDYTKTRHDAIEPHGRRALMELEHHIHCLETEAYSSVLKAFIAQSDLLTWGKEGLMTELRKELNVTDVEHGEILLTINSDESIKWIREQRKLASHAQDYLKVDTPGYASSSMENSTLRLKTSSCAAFYPHKSMPHGQCSLAAIPIPSSLPPKFKDDRQTAKLAMFSHGTAEQSMEMFNHNVQLPPVSRDGVAKARHPLKKGFHKPEIGSLKSRSDLIEIRATDRVIRDVEQMLFNRENPDPIQIERAKLTLREQERAILEALAKLAKVLDRDDPSNQMRHYHVPKDTLGLGHEKMVHGNFCGQVGRLNVMRD